jgi:PAS domain S-box-containing protein
MMDDKQKILSQQEEIKNLLAAVPGGIFKYEAKRKGQFTLVSPEMLRLLGYTESEFRTKFHNCFDDMVYEEDREKVLQSIDEQMRYGVFDTCEYRIETKSGALHWFYDVGHQVVDENGKKWFYVVVIDVEDRKRLQEERERKEELEKQLIAAQAASAAKSQFLSSVSHDIRTPLNGIIGMTNLAKEEKDPRKIQAYLAKIDTSSKFLLGLINDILDMVKVESGKINLHPEPYTIEEFNNYLDAVIKPLCKEKDQKFILQEDVTVKKVPLADKLHMNQILFNLLSNAVKYTPEGGTITYTIKGKELADNKVCIEHVISDTGIGMSAEFQKKLFEPFTQEGRNDISNTRGSGLGLAIVKRLVDFMGGTITVQSQLGKGSTFTVRLNFDSVPAASCTAVADSTDSGDEFKCLQGKHILMCEDHPLNQEIVKALLLKKGMQVTIAEDGQQGVEFFRKASHFFYDAVLMDIRMPILNGYEATQAIRSLDRADAKTIPIIAMTADVFAEDIKNCLAKGMNGHISKPIDAGQLYKTLAQKIKTKH